LLVYDVTRKECKYYPKNSGSRAHEYCTIAFDHVTSWLDDLRSHADDNVAIIRGYHMEMIVYC
jgi:hypothetical protein